MDACEAIARVNHRLGALHGAGGSSHPDRDRAAASARFICRPGYILVYGTCLDREVLGSRGARQPSGVGMRSLRRFQRGNVKGEAWRSRQLLLIDRPHVRALARSRTLFSGPRARAARNSGMNTALDGAINTTDASKTLQLSPKPRHSCAVRRGMATDNSPLACNSPDLELESGDAEEVSWPPAWPEVPAGATPRSSCSCRWTGASGCCPREADLSAPCAGTQGVRLLPAMRPVCLPAGWAQGRVPGAAGCQRQQPRRG